MKLIGGKIKKRPYAANPTPVISVVRDQSILGHLIFMFLLIVKRILLQALLVLALLHDHMKRLMPRKRQSSFCCLLFESLALLMMF
jgi:hypothetical protein